MSDHLRASDNASSDGTVELARKLGARLLLRLEDLDPDRARPEWSLRLREDLAWLGLDFDAEEEQHRSEAPAAASA